jgi:hypothetical protein
VQKASVFVQASKSDLTVIKTLANRVTEFITTVVERIDLMSFDRICTRPIVMAADLSRRHKSDDFNSFLIHLFCEG